VTPAERRRLLDALAKPTAGDLKSFFVAHGLGYAFENERNRGDNKRKKVADTVDAAERRDGDDRVLRAAVETFGLGELLEAYVAPGLPQLVEEMNQRADWANVQRALTVAAAEAYTNPAGAITASRTAIESVCKHICEERGVDYKDTDDLPALYKRTVRAFNLSPEQHGDDAAVRQTLQGAVTVVNGLALSAMLLGMHTARARARQTPRTPTASWQSTWQLA
jgi:hypothetical protein